MTLQVGVKVLLKNSEGEVLVLHRNEEKYGKTKGTWDIPGGRIELGQSLLENLKREIREEAGLPLTSQPVLVGAQDILKEDRHVVRLTYVASTEGTPVLNGEEHTEYAWVPASELPTLEDLDFYVRALLDEGNVVL